MRFDDNFDPRCNQDQDPTRPSNWNINCGPGGGREQSIQSSHDDEGVTDTVIRSQSDIDDDNRRRWGSGPSHEGYGS